MGEAVERVSAGVPAREEGRRSRAFDHIDEQEAFVRRNRMPVSQSSIVEDQGRSHSVVQVRCTFHVSGSCSHGPRFGARLFDPLVIPEDASSASSSSCHRVSGKGQDGNLDQSAISKSGARNAPGDKKVDAGNVKEELAVLPRWARPFYVPSSDMPNLFSHLCGYGRPPLELRMLGSQWISAEPVSNEFSVWYKPNVRRPSLSRSRSLDVGPPSVGNAPRGASVGEDDDVHIGGLQFPG